MRSVTKVKAPASTAAENADSEVDISLRSGTKRKKWAGEHEGQRLYKNIDFEKRSI